MNQLEVRSILAGKEIKDFLDIDFALQPYNLKDTKLPFSEIAVNVGSYCFFIEDDNNNYLWLPDQPYREGSFGYIGGEKYASRSKTIGSTRNILETNHDPIFQTQQIGIEAYKFDVPKGNYELNLCFAELYPDSVNVFDIMVNSQLILKALNIKEQYGAGRAVTKRFQIEVDNENGLNITFKPIEGKTSLSGIKLRKIY
jgi:beta-galactosidase